jgi:hypothetical protein
MPTWPAASASSADLAGLRMALPSGSPEIKAAATISPAEPSAGMTANSGTGYPPPGGANIYAVAGAPATSDDYLQSSQAALDAAHLGRDSMKTVK